MSDALNLSVSASFAEAPRSRPVCTEPLFPGTICFVSVYTSTFKVRSCRTNAVRRNASGRPICTRHFRMGY